MIIQDPEAGVFNCDPNHCVEVINSLGLFQTITLV